MMGGEWGSGWMGFGGIWMLLFWVLVILGIIVLIRRIWVRPGESGADFQPTALEILKGRYARGEIDREEYEQMRRDLSN